jgi:hypothetical protein
MAHDGKDAKTLTDAIVFEYKKVKDDLDKHSDQSIRETLTSQQSALGMEIDGLIKMRFSSAGKLGADSPEQLRVMLTQRLGTLKDKLQDKERELTLARWEASASDVTSQPADVGRLADLALQARRLEQEIALLKKDVSNQQTQIDRAGVIALEIANYDEQIRQKRELYEAVRSRREQMNMEDKAPNRLRVVSFATEPSSGSDKRPPVTLGILAAAGLLSMLLLAIRPAYVAPAKL